MEYDRLAHNRAYYYAHREEILSLIKMYNRDHKQCCDLKRAARFAKRKTND
jgi:hypothetical protein